GRIVAVVRTTAVQAAPRSANVATSVVAGGGSGIRRSTILVMTPSVPSLPTNSFMSDSPAASLSSLPPSSTTLPSASTTSSPSTWSVVAPYLTQHRPPALVATLPPIVENVKLAGSGGYQSPCSAAAALRSALTTPGCTVAVSVVGSISTSVMSARQSTSPPST